MYISSGNRKFNRALTISIVVIAILQFNNFNAFAFNEFQTFIEQKSKKQLNCAYCHSNTNGPEGNDLGQLGSLSEEQKQLTAYNQFLNGKKEFIDSPILNELGNYLVKSLGYEEIINAQDDPNRIVEKLEHSDFDKDGITDGEEITDGTLLNDPLDGNPLKLFKNNLQKKWKEILFQIMAIILLAISLFKLKEST